MKDSVSGKKWEVTLGQGALVHEGNGHVWIGCEAGVMPDIRRHLLHERGMDRTHAHTQGYWKYGAMNHPDNDRGQDVG
jgi:NADPH-dependent ferric siderophore reductase